jgi:hypothetical protein
LQKQLQQQQKQQVQPPQKVDSKQKQSKAPVKGASPIPAASAAAAAAAPVVDLHQQQQIEEMTQQLRAYEAEIEDLKGQLLVRAYECKNCSIFTMFLSLTICASGG